MRDYVERPPEAVSAADHPAIVAQFDRMSGDMGDGGPTLVLGEEAPKVEEAEYQHSGEEGGGAPAL